MNEGDLGFSFAVLQQREVRGGLSDGVAHGVECHRLGPAGGAEAVSEGQQIEFDLLHLLIPIRTTLFITQLRLRNNRSTRTIVPTDRKDAR